jgi:hypothetical protein
MVVRYVVEGVGRIGIRRKGRSGNKRRKDAERVAEHPSLETDE